MKDKAPRLLDYMVGFQLVDRNEDNTKAMGLFGVKVGDQWLYCPTFFLNGDLKGHELLYIKKQDAFVPMKENWVNYLISRKPHVLGEASPQNSHQLGGMPPNLYRFNRPPSVSKYGADARGTPRTPEVAAWAADFCAFVGAVGVKSAAALYRGVAPAGATLDIGQVAARPFAAALAEVKEAFDLHSFVRRDFRLLKAAFEASRRHPLLKTGFDRFYGADFFSKAAADYKAHHGSLHKAGMDDWYACGGDPVAFARTTAEKRRRAAGRPKVASLLPETPPPARGVLRVFTYDHATQAVKVAADTSKVDEDAPSGFKKNTPALTDEEREKLLSDGVLIDDRRATHEKAEVYDTQVRMELTNPTETGVYDVLEKPGKFSPMLVVMHPQTNRGREPFATVVRTDSPANWLNVHASNLWVKPNAKPDRPDFDAWWKDLPEGSLDKGGYYLAIGANGAGTTPFEVDETYDDGAYKVNFREYCQYGMDRPTWARRSGFYHGLDPISDGYDYVSCYGARLFVNQREGTGLRSVNGELSVPKSFKLFKLKAPPPPPKDDRPSLMGCSPPMGECEGAGSEKKPIRPGNIADVQLLLHEKTAGLKLIDQGGEVVLKSPLGDERLSKKAALVSLVVRHRLGEDQARELLKRAASPKGHVSVRLKNAYHMNADLSGGPNAPTFPDPNRGMEQIGYNQVPAEYPQEVFEPVSDNSSDRTDPAIYDPFYEPDQGAMQMAQEASQSGQKEVFDTSMVSGMLKAVRQDTMVDRHLGDLMKALDKLGRILFMFYWHSEEFEDRYGKQDLPELEDSLRNAFEVLGDVCLFLKEKQVGGGLDGFGAGGNKGEPDIQEAARN